MTNIEESGNRIIAHFMGVEFTDDLNYHSDWNKLMSVWVKLPVKYFNNNRVSMDYIVNCRKRQRQPSTK